MHLSLSPCVCKERRAYDGAQEAVRRVDIPGGKQGGGAAKAAEESEKPEKRTAEKEETLDELMAQLDSLIGLETVKREVRSLINLIKVPWGRVRMRQIYKTSESYFTPWWQAGSTLKKKLMAEGVSSDEFRSFPSGHTACAACAMLIGLLPTLRKGKEKRTRLLFILGCLWAAAVAISRIWMGAHFLTDVTMAWLIALGMCALCVHLFYFDKRFFAKLWRVLSTSANPFLPKKRSVESPDSEPEN